MQPITIDFETYYDAEYSLRDLTTREYILHPLFEVVGVAVKVGNGKTQWFTGSKKATKEWLDQFNWENALCIAHNAIFDGGILEWVFDIKPKMYFCTMMGSRPIDVPYMGKMGLAPLSIWNKLGIKGTEVSNAKGIRRVDFDGTHMNAYAGYCIQDVNLCYKLATIYLRQFPKKEIKNLDLTIKKFTRPQLVLDAAGIEERLIKHRMEKVALLGECGLESADVLMSNDRFAGALQTLGVSPPRKISPRTGKENWAFAKSDLEFMKLLDHPNPKVALLVEARLGHKSTIEETRLSRFLATAHLPGAWLSVPLLYWGAGTGRYSGLDKLNLQNLPSRGEVGPALRKAIRAPKGRKVLACDFSAIELRMVAAFCNQLDLLKQLQEGEDSYSIFIAGLYHIAVEDVDKDQRFIGKLCLLSLQYGSGAAKFWDTMLNAGLDMTEQEAKNIVKYYRNRMGNIVKMWRTLDGCINEMANKNCNMRLGPVVFKYQCIELPNGTKLIFADLQRNADGDWVYKKGYKWVKLYGAMLLENISQALSRIVMTDAELVLSEKGLNAALSVHDELIYVPKTEHVGVYTRVIEHVMSQAPEWLPQLPVACESSYGQSYYDAK